MACPNCGAQLPPGAAFCGSCGARLQGGAPAAQAPSDVPQPALERLRTMRGGDGRKPLFTSDLSVDEFMLVKKAGFDPLGLVIGSSIYHIGYQQSNWNQNQEMQVLSQAMYQARELAMTRMEEEASVLGADGVVGVRLDVGMYEWGENLAEFMAVGTAIKARGGEGESQAQGYRTVHGKPFTSDLSGQDFYVLHTSGYVPAGLVMGSCVYHVAYQGLRQAFRTMYNNVEMANFTQALYEARELAMERMQAEAESLGAEGIVGMQLQQRNYAWGSHVIEYFAVGTAVVPRADDHVIPDPTLSLPLNA